MLYIFDWDGTVCDSADKIIRCMQESARDNQSRIPTPEEVKNIIGLALPEVMDILFPEESLAKRDDIRAGYSKYYLKHDQAEPCPLFDGARETLEKLKADGYKLAVATGKSRRGLDRVLAEHGLSDFFDATRGADETASKPDPLMLNELLDELGVAVGSAVMVGDTEYDMEMAARINMPRIGVSYGAHHIDRVKKHDPILCVDHFSEILNFQFNLAVCN